VLCCVGAGEAGGRHLSQQVRPSAIILHGCPVLCCVTSVEALSRWHAGPPAPQFLHTLGLDHANRMPTPNFPTAEGPDK